MPACDDTAPPQRCAWVSDDALYRAYHDHEWGRPEHDDRRLFELLILEGAQAGLSWLTVLRKREGYRRAFAGFDPALVAAFGPAEVERLLADPGIVRNRLKIGAAIANARVVLELQARHGSLDHYIWRFVDGQPQLNRWANLAQVPAHTALSDQLSRELKRAGMRFVGTTICYAFMQAAGLVCDHTTDCFCHPDRQQTQ